VAGNIGRPFAEVTRAVPDDGLVVLEVSSFQLERIEQFTPQIGILLNLTPDHLDRYDSFDGYCNAKYRLFENQESHQFAILNADDRESRRRKFNYRSRQLYFALKEENLPGQSAEGVLLRGGTLLGRLAGNEFEIIAADKVGIPGEHNLSNAAAAAAAALAIEISPKVITNAVQGFRGVEHRLEQVATVAGIDFVNDSKGTNVDSVLVALKSIPGKINLIAGGRDKGGDFTRLLVAAKDKVENIVVLGEASEKIFEQLGRHIPVVMARSMADAVDKAFELSHSGFTVLLSPGCASFDMYKNFEERGRDFKDLVRKLKNGKGSGTAVEV
jgi:UDP-N-acetylmuramoylalanine--D-glutamate ligase